MTAVLLLAVAGTGGLGAVTRFVLDAVLRLRFPSTLPIGTLVINLSGSLLLGVVTGLAASAVVPQELRAVVGTGFLGGYTTFSTTSVEVLRLVETGRRRAGLLVAAGQAAGGVLLAGLGLALTLR